MDIHTYYGKKLEVLPHAEVRKAARNAPPKEIKKVYIVGICGTAMGSIAGLLKQAGYQVGGWDAGVYPPMSTMLETLGITIDTTIVSDHIDTADVVVVGNAIGPTHEVVEYAREKNMSLVSLSEILDLCIFKGRKRLVIAGTHGKTTTTGIVASIFSTAGKDPGFLIGGVMQGADTGFNLGSGEYFIIEGDEYDTAYFDKRPKFLTYGGDGGMVTSIELDHLDIYSDLEDYTQAFTFFAEQLPSSGHVCVAYNPEIQKAFVSTSHVHTYGFDEGADIVLTNISQTPTTQKGTLIYHGKELGVIETPLSGKHNLANVIGAAGLAYAYGIPFEDIQKGIIDFKGMKRRQEVVADGYATLIDDFAHHPTAVTETILGIKKRYEGRRLVALFEPRSNTSRRKVFEDAYVKSLLDADLVLIKQPAMRHNDDVHNYINASHMVDILSHKGVPAYTAEQPEKIIEYLKSSLQKRDVILMMSNGSFDGLRESIAEIIQNL